MNKIFFIFKIIFNSIFFKLLLFLFLFFLINTYIDIKIKL